jgi:hypothetical protein
MASPEVLTDGTCSFSGGVDSIKVPSVAGPENPDGLRRDQLAWLINGAIRDGGITPRSGWQPLGGVASGSAGIFQGEKIYEPLIGNPYFIVMVAGNVYSVTTTTPPVVTNLSAIFATYTDPMTMPVNQVHAYFCQAEQFMIIQSGDLVTLPLFWDGNVLRRSNGIISPNNIPNEGYPVSDYNELPAGGPMVYYQGRVWIGQWNGQPRVYCAGDIVGSQASGTSIYNYTDSVLRVTECPLATGGDGFTIPTQAGNITALDYSANLDVTLGQGTLFIFTRKQVYSLTVPITRIDWTGTTLNNIPLQQVVQITNGSVNDRSVLQVNGDLFFQSLNLYISSLSMCLRYFQQWGNAPVSANEWKILQYSNRALMEFTSGIQFNNRALMTALPKQTPQGVVFPAIVPLDFTPMSSFNRKKDPAWEGHYEGLDFLQLSTADFGGLERAFGFVVSPFDGSIQLWELTLQDQFENGDNRITMVVTTPSFDFHRPFELKNLVSLEIWFDRLYGSVDFQVFYLPDQYPCPLKWAEWKECAARNAQEDASWSNSNPLNSYPSANTYQEQYRATKTLPRPPQSQTCNPATNRPFNIGYSFQIVIQVTGFCRIRGLYLKALPVEKGLYTGLIST